MRFFLAVSASILNARLTLSARSSSTELEAVLASPPSFFKRSMTSALSTPRSRASWKTRTLCIHVTPAFPAAFRRRRRFRLRRGFGRRLLGGRALGLQAGRLFGVALVPFGLGMRRRFPDLLDRLRPDALDGLQLF